jgi:hypothetical protein
MAFLFEFMRVKDNADASSTARNLGQPRGKVLQKVSLEGNVRTKASAFRKNMPGRELVQAAYSLVASA